MCAWPTRACASGRRRRATATSTCRPSSRPPSITGADAIHPGYGFLVRERRLRRDGGGARPDLHRPVAGAYPHDGRQDRRQGGDGARSACRWCRARTARCRMSRRRAQVAGRIGYPVLIKAAAGGGGRGMKVARDADALEEAFAHRAHRGARRVRQRRRVYREISRPSAPYRVADPRRRARQRRAFRRARLQPAAAPSEAAGGSRLAGAERRRSATRSAPPPPRRWRSSATATPARWSSCIRTGSSRSSR